MEQIKITKISRFKEDKNGQPLVSSSGRPYVRVMIEDSTGRKMSGFGNQDNSGWNDGDEVSVDVTQKGEYLNFATPKSTFQKSGGVSSVEYQTILRDMQAIKTDTQIIIGMIEKRFPTNIPYPDSVGNPEF